MFSSVNLSALCLLCAAGSAQAILFQGSASGSWIDPNTTENVVVDNNDMNGAATIRWGEAFFVDDTPSQFSFNGQGSDGDAGWMATLATPFLIGDFTYQNSVTLTQDTEFTGVDLSISLSISNPIGLTQLSTFDFNVTNTPNLTGDDVLDGDIVTVVNSTSPESFSYLGNDYVLQLLGFSSDNGTTIRNDFSSPENGIAQAGIFAEITTLGAVVPEPSSFALLAMGLIGLFRLSKKA